MYQPGTFIEDPNFGKGFILEVTENKEAYRMRVDFIEHGKKYIKVNKDSIFDEKDEYEELL